MDLTRWLIKATRGPNGVYDTEPPIETLFSVSSFAFGLLSPSIRSQMSTTKLKLLNMYSVWYLPPVAIYNNNEK
jgi:hypothetical protein